MGGKLNAGMMSSTTDEWATPQDFFDGLNQEFGFGLDVCATAENAKCDAYYTKKQDGLTQAWNEDAAVCWMNPPYGRQISAWMKKAYTESRRGVTVVCLVPARTDTAWWHEYAMRGEIRFIRGRLKFGGLKTAHSFPRRL